MALSPLIGALFGIWRALFGPMSMAHGPFCLILG